MTTSYAKIKARIKSLEARAEELRRKEIKDVIARVKEAIEFYGLTAAELGFSPSGKLSKVAKPWPRKGPNGSKSVRPPKYRDSAGNTWVGRGPRPQWLRDAMAAGKTLDDFRI